MPHKITTLAEMRQITEHLPDHTLFFLRDYRGALLWVAAIEETNGTLIADLLPDAMAERFPDEPCKTCAHWASEPAKLEGSCVLRAFPRPTCIGWRSRLAEGAAAVKSNSHLYVLASPHEPGAPPCVVSKVDK